jgi:hypothetical protein
MNKKIAIGIGSAVLTIEVVTVGHKAITGDKAIVPWEEHEKCIHLQESNAVTNGTTQSTESGSTESSESEP